MESLYDLWGKRNPEWEKKYEDSVINVFVDYGKGVTQWGEARGKIFGAGYEIFIIAFFIGLYYNQEKPLIEDKSKRKSFGWAICNWGNQEARNGRTPYPRLREYIFAALIARSDIDFIALDKGEITARKAVDILIDKMERYANWGFDFIKEKMEDNPEYFFNESSFLRIFLDLMNQSKNQEAEDDMPEEL